MQQELATEIATVIHAGFVTYHTQFKSITRRAQKVFENRDWSRGRINIVRRLELYSDIVNRKVDDVNRLLEEEQDPRDLPLWKEVKRQYVELIASRKDIELAETFFNSITRRVFDTVGVNPEIEFIYSAAAPPPPPTHAIPDICHGFASQDYGPLPTLIRAVLTGLPLNAEFENIDRDVAQIATRIEDELTPAVTRIDIVSSLFFRGQAAYVIGQLWTPSGSAPLVIALRNRENGVYCDAILLTEDEMSIVFSFAHSYFHIDTVFPAALVAFLKSILPLKPIADLWISVGYNRHGKTIQYRDLLDHLDHSDDLFVTAPGTPGMVMHVFTLPSYEMVFKIIKDEFDYPKKSTRKDVMASYRLVFQHDRAGRLLDAQKFEHLTFDKERFEPGLLKKLLDVASESVSVEGDQVVISLLYTERQVTPLNLYLAQADEEAQQAVVREYGQAIRDLARSNIFPGDLFLKNFGVTRHGRVLFYDYDELCFVTDCNFRDIPESPYYEDDLSSEPWYTVNEGDVFPEQFIHFLGLKPHLKRQFLKEDRDLMTADFWRSMQTHHEIGQLPSVYPYLPDRRFPRPSVP